MVENSQEEHDREEPKFRFTRLEQSIVALKKMVTQMMAMRGMQYYSVRTDYGEKNTDLEDSKNPKVRTCRFR